MTAIKRVNRRRPSYFHGQLLDEKDFLAEQEYHRANLRRHHATFHSWGVIEGLTVTVDNGRAVVAPGVAVDSFGREVRLDEPAVLELTGFSRGESFHILLAYEEDGGETRPTEHGASGASGIAEYSVVSASTTAARSMGSSVRRNAPPETGGMSATSSPSAKAWLRPT